MFVHQLERVKEQLLAQGLIRYQYPDSPYFFELTSHPSKD
jgi:hypothetical protein